MLRLFAMSGCVFFITYKKQIDMDVDDDSPPNSTLKNLKISSRALICLLRTWLFLLCLWSLLTLTHTTSKCLNNPFQFNSSKNRTYYTTCVIRKTILYTPFLKAEHTRGVLLRVTNNVQFLCKRCSHSKYKESLELSFTQFVHWSG